MGFLLGGMALLGDGLALLVPWLQIRPNRISEGTFRFLGDDPVWAGLVLGLWTLPVVLALVGNRPKVPVRVAWICALLVPCVLVFGAGATAGGLVPDGSFVRVSPSWTFWASLLAAYGWSLVLGPRTGWSRNVLRVGAAVFPVVCGVGLAAGAFGSLSLLKEYQAQGPVFWSAVVGHLWLAGVAVAVGTGLGMVVGWGAHRLARFREAAFFFLNLVQTLPSLALFGLLIVPLAALGVGGIGPAPALVALSLYAAFPIARSTLTALENLDPAVLDAGRGLGMGRGQLFARIQVPLALPVVLEGIRTASVQAVGNTVVAALIGAGGLGSLVFLGLGQYAPDLILLGTLPVVVLALGIDGLWAGVLGLVPGRFRR